jgi:hypothetical protein
VALTRRAAVRHTSVEAQMTYAVSNALCVGLRGSVSIKLMLLSLDSEAKFEPVNEQPNHQLVHLNRFRKAHGFSH